MESKSDRLLEEIISRLKSTPTVTAAWLAGSRGRGTNDEFSDIDIWVAMQDSAVPPVVEDPLAFVHSIVPTVMHIHAPSIAPAGGAFLGSWVPVDDEFVQVDWYITPENKAQRDPDTKMVFGGVPVRATLALTPLPEALAVEKAEHNLVLAMQSVNNMVKYSRRGRIWAAVNSARHGDDRLKNARGLLTVGEEPGFGEGGDSFLPEPVPSTVREIQDLALTLLEEISILSEQTTADLDHAIIAIRNQIINWRQTGWKPTEEYYRTLPRRYMGSGVLCTDTSGNVLILETTYKDVHEIPGGVCEAGESPRETARREVKEELGIELEIGRLLVMDSRSRPEPKGDAVMYVYDGGVIENPAILQPDGNEIAQVKFVPIDQVEEYCTPQMAARLRAAMLARERDQPIEISNGEIIA